MISIQKSEIMREKASYPTSSKTQKNWDKMNLEIEHDIEKHKVSHNVV